MGTQSRYSLVAALTIVLQGMYVWLLSKAFFPPGVVSELRSGVGTYNPYVSAVEGAFFALFALVGAVILLYLSKIKISVLRIVSLGALSVTLYFSMLMLCPYDSLTCTVVCGLATAFLILLQGVVRDSSVNFLASMLTSGIVGVMLATMFTEVQLSFILLFLSLYDIYSVFKGPISKMFRPSEAYSEKLPEYLRGLFVNMGGIHVGIGDLIMYSSLMGASALLRSVVLHISVLTGVGIGVLATLFMVKKYGMFPGLPIPSLFGLIFFWVLRCL